MDVLIVYERKQRELDNSVLLKIELEQRGLSCEIVQFYEADKFNLLNRYSPKVIVVPHLYNTESYYRTLARFGHASHIVNMQYEQVLSKKWEDLGAHTPKGDARKGIHICWGSNVAERLLSSGVSEENIEIISPLHLDLLRSSFLEVGIKNSLGSRFDIDSSKHWTVFLSSFTYADIDDNRLNMNESAAGIALSEFPIIHSRSRNEILNWFRSALELNSETILIYRPHPDELSLDVVNLLEVEFDNFFVIRDLPVKDWIQASDSIYTWYSTSIVEAHFMGKPYSILRPFDLPDDFDSVLLKNGSFLKKKDDFLSEYLDGGPKSTAIDDVFMKKYYSVDSRYAKDLLADVICNLMSREGSSNINITSLYIISFFKSLAIIPVYLLSKILSKNIFGNRSLYGLIFTEIKNQILGLDEKKAVEARLLQVLDLDNKKI